MSESSSSPNVIATFASLAVMILRPVEVSFSNTRAFDCAFAVG